MWWACGRPARARWKSSVTASTRTSTRESDPRAQCQIAEHTVDDMSVEGDVAWDAETHGLAIPSSRDQSANADGPAVRC